MVGDVEELVQIAKAVVEKIGVLTGGSCLMTLTRGRFVKAGVATAHEPTKRLEISQSQGHQNVKSKSSRNG